MRTTNFLQPAGATWRTLLGLILACAADTSNAQPAQPSIASVRLEGTNVVITAVVSPGLRRVTLECRERLGAGSWAPRAVTRPDGSCGSVTFRLPRSRPFEVIRVRGDAVEPLPASFFTGTNSFYEQPSAGVGGPRTPGPVAIDSIGASPQEGSREVVESDIWKIRGTTLYFFNQLRGLQVIDVTHPDTAVVRGLLELPAAGEQMYLLGGNYVVLLTRNGCSSDERDRKSTRLNSSHG